MLGAKSAVPTATRGNALSPLFERTATAGTNLFTSLPGFFSDDSLADVLRQHERPMLWLRIGKEDQDPATLLLSMIASARRIKPGIGEITLERMRQNPGPLMGWPPLYNSLAQEFFDSLPTSTSIVLEHLHRLASIPSTLNLLGRHLLTRLPASFSQNLTSFQDLPVSALPCNIHRYSAEDLKIDFTAGQALAESNNTNLSDICLRKVIKLCDGRTVALSGILALCQFFGSSFIEGVVHRTKNANQLLTLLLRTGLEGVSAEEIRALMLAQQLEYVHPELSKAALGNSSIPIGPWMQSLSDDWSRLRFSWQAPLENILGNKKIPNPVVLQNAAHYLASQNVPERAIPIFLQLGDFHKAAQVLSDVSEGMLNTGQWVSLREWLNCIPSEVLNDWPWLVYTRGELAAVTGNIVEAKHFFATSASLFSTHFEREGACQSLLAQSTLSAWNNDFLQAKSLARLAESLAQVGGHELQKGWAYWSLGCLNAATCDFDAALNYFSKASSVILPPSMFGLVEQAEILALKQHQIQQQIEFHRHATLILAQEEQSTNESLKLITSKPPENLPDLLGSFGWKHTPLILKLPMPEQIEKSKPEIKPGVWQMLLSTLTVRRRDIKMNPDPISELNLEKLDFPQSLHEIHIDAINDQIAENHYSLTTNELSINSTREQELALVITAYLLGKFRVSINDKSVEKWPGNRCLALFKYFLTYKSKEISRDVLMDVFWPDVNPEAARNNLNVTFHKLRQVFGPLSKEQVIIFEQNKYRLNPIFQVWTDIDDFEGHFRAGSQLETSGRINAAINEFEAATNLYQGDYLSEDPYEDWAVSTRERLRVIYLETLDRLSRIYFSQGQYSTCIVLCQRILDCDNCREDAICRLMRCYSRQGQHNLAIRQYQDCVKVLKEELDVEPEASTIQLAEKIRRHERV